MQSKQFTLAELSKHVEGECRGDSSLLIDGLATIQDAVPGKLAFLANPAYQKYIASTSASALILSPKVADGFEGACIVHKNPYLAYAMLSELWDPVLTFEPSISKESSIHATAKIGSGVYIGAGSRICAGVEIGEGAYIAENCVVGPDCLIGDRTKIYPNVTIYHGVKIGDNCTLQAGVVVGSDGFGFAPTGDPDKAWRRISQLGGVVIGNDVEVGANTTIDRGALDNTYIADGVILDNQIQIAHNVSIGSNTAVAACSAIAGSTSIGRDCIIGGATGIAGHLTIADKVTITAMTMVIKDLPKSGVYSSGTGVQSNKDWKRSIARLRRLDATESRLKAVEKQLRLIGNDGAE